MEALVSTRKTKQEELREFFRSDSFIIKVKTTSTPIYWNSGLIGAIHRAYDLGRASRTYAVRRVIIRANARSYYFSLGKELGKVIRGESSRRLKYDLQLTELMKMVSDLDALPGLIKHNLKHKIELPPRPNKRTLKNKDKNLQFWLGFNEIFNDKSPTKAQL